MPPLFPELASRWFGIGNAPAPPPPESWVQLLADTASTTGLAIGAVASLAYRSVLRSRQEKQKPKAVPMGRGAHWCSIPRLEEKIALDQESLAKVSERIKTEMNEAVLVFLKAEREKLQVSIDRATKKLVVKKANKARVEPTASSKKKKKSRRHRINKARRLPSPRISSTIEDAAVHDEQEAQDHNPSGSGSQETAEL